MAKLPITHDLLWRYKDEILASIHQAVQEALWEHKLLGNPVAVGENGKVKIIQPEDLVLDERFHPAKRNQNDGD